MLIKHSSLALLLLFAASTSLYANAGETVLPKAPPLSPRPFGDMSKSAAEFPIKSIINNRGASFRRVVDQEGAGNSPFNPAKPESVSPAKSVDFTKPASKPQPATEKVEPGKVRWHKAVQTAMDASRQSGKPVLLFQMMGRLDDRFC